MVEWDYFRPHPVFTLRTTQSLLREGKEYIYHYRRSQPGQVNPHLLSLGPINLISFFIAQPFVQLPRGDNH